MAGQRDIRRAVGGVRQSAPRGGLAGRARRPRQCEYTVRYVLSAPVGGHRARDWAEHYTTARACTDLQYE